MNCIRSHNVGLASSGGDVRHDVIVTMVTSVRVVLGDVENGLSVMS
jgi:hypothetical protein